MTSTPFTICSRALVKLGANGITSFNEGTAESKVASYLYETTRDGLLAAYPWRFATAQSELVELADSPLADYSHAFALPADFLRALSAGCGCRGQGLNYRLYEQALHCNQDKVMLTYLFRPLEVNFPTFFEQALVAKLAAEFCLPLTESTSRCEFLIKQADNEFKNAKLIDAQQSIPSALSGFSLIGVRV